MLKSAIGKDNNNVIKNSHEQSSLQFTYLMEGDEGMYTCNVMIPETKNLYSLE